MVSSEHVITERCLTLHCVICCQYGYYDDEALPQQNDDVITTVCCPDDILCHSTLALSKLSVLNPGSMSGNWLSYAPLM